MFNTRHLSVAICSFSLIATSCAFIVDDSPDTYADTVYTYPDSTRYDFADCENSGNFSYCAANADNSHDYAWQPNCQSKDCQAVSLFVHYNLTQDLGPAATLWVEAFDNPYFNGPALSTFRMSRFDTSSPSTSAREEMFLDPGEYYLRAYVTTKTTAPLPADLQGLEPEQAAIGTFGALSKPERVVIQKGSSLGAVHINIDQFLTDPAAPLNTGAKLRTKVTMEDDIAPPENRKLLLKLFQNPNIDEVPLYQFATTTNELLLESTGSRAEILTSDLEPGSYYAFAFIDEDSNDYFDYGEPAAFYEQYGEPWPVEIKTDFTTQLDLMLSYYPELP